MSSFKQTARKIKTRMVRGASIYTCHTCSKTEESFDTDWWTFNAMLAIIENQLKDLDDNIFPIYD